VAAGRTGGAERRGRAKKKRKIWEKEQQGGATFFSVEGGERYTGVENKTITFRHKREKGKPVGTNSSGKNGGLRREERTQQVEGKRLKLR